MNLNFRAVCRITGLVLFAVGGSMLPALAVSIVYEETDSFFSFSATILFAVFAGIFLRQYGQMSDAVLKVRDGFFIVTLCWLVSSLLGAVPFMVSGSIPNFFDAFFESCSGFSTTGASILKGMGALPKSILFWRSFTQWMGGIGILLFAIALMPSLGINGQNIAVSETPGTTLDKVTAKMSDAAKTLCAIYLLFTIMETILLCLGGMSFYDALIHTFGSVSTGGFSNYNDGIAHFDSICIEIVLMVFMLLAGVNFNLYFLALKSGISGLFKDAELRFYLLIPAAAAVLIAANLYFSHFYPGAGSSIRCSVFQTVSILTTTGFAAADFNLWPAFSKMLILLLMFIGGCASSAGGGIKVARILIVLKLIRRAIATKLHPNAVVTVKMNGRTVPADTVTAVCNHIFLYMAVVFISGLLLSLNNFDLVTSYTSVLTCIGNIGPGFELTGPTANFSIFAAPSKLLLSLLMLAGRLELFTMLILLTPKFWNPNH